MSINLASILNKSRSGALLSEQECLTVLNSNDFSTLSLLNGTYEIRQSHWGNEVQIHILNNVQNGACPEECHYCAQAKSSKASIQKYPKKSENDILEEAKKAYESGAHRYCMVFSGRGPRKARTAQMASLVQKIKKTYPLEVCVSCGLLDEDDATTLKEAGLDRLNHNLNTSKNHYETICDTHTFDDRLKTLRAAQKSGLELCSGVIIGMGESHEDICDVALNLRSLKVESIPVNFYMPIEGTTLVERNIKSDLTPDFCLRVLCLFRLLNPTAEIRVAAGRELHLRSLQPLALYPANSLFMEGYLNTKGSSVQETLQMVKDLGFSIKSTQSLDDLLESLNIKNSLLESNPKLELKGAEELFVNV